MVQLLMNKMNDPNPTRIMVLHSPKLGGLGFINSLRDTWVVSKPGAGAVTFAPPPASPKLRWEACWAWPRIVRYNRNRLGSAKPGDWAYAMKQKKEKTVDLDFMS